VDPRADLDDVEKRKFLTLPGHELRPLDRPARNQPLYLLRCPAPTLDQFETKLNLRDCFYCKIPQFHILSNLSSSFGIEISEMKNMEVLICVHFLHLAHIMRNNYSLFYFKISVFGED
jgi:hypothetical protein